MLLSGRMLNDVANVNSFEPVETLKATENDTIDVYFQLVDKSLDTPQQGFYPSGRRYMPAAGATLQVVMQSIDGAKTLTRFAVQPFTQDPSIWRLPVLSSDKIKGTYNLQLTLTEGGKVTRGVIQQAVAFASLTEAFC